MEVKPKQQEVVEKEQIKVASAEKIQKRQDETPLKESRIPKPSPCIKKKENVDAPPTRLPAPIVVRKRETDEIQPNDLASEELFQRNLEKALMNAE